MADEGYGLPVGVGFEREGGFLGLDLRFQGGELLWRWPAGVMGQDLRRPPCPFVGAAKHDLHLGHDLGEATGRPHELLFPLRRERSLAVVWPSLRVALV